MRLDISRATFSKVVRNEITELRTRSKLNDAAELEGKLKKFERRRGETVYDTYRSSGQELRSFIDSKKYKVASSDSEYREKKTAALRALDSKIGQMAQAAVPGDLSRLAAVKAMEFVEERKATELDYAGAINTSEQQRVLKGSRGNTLQEVHTRKHIAVRRAEWLDQKVGEGDGFTFSIGTALAVVAGALGGPEAAFGAFFCGSALGALVGDGVAETIQDAKTSREFQRDTVEQITTELSRYASKES